MRGCTSCRQLIHDERKAALTGRFGDLVQSRVHSDPAFRAALLRESVDIMLSGNVDGGKTNLCDYISRSSR